MGQVKVYGLATWIDDKRAEISNAIHASVVEAFEFPEDKRFHRFIKLAAEDFIFPDSRTNQYIIIEISIFEGRSDLSKRNLINLLFMRLAEIGIDNNDVEITIFETPKKNWGIRGLPADELTLNYKVEI
jgi:phenylpyruvate tautomerase PptA (4-oxalocrotonate tautomerase family)